MPDKKKDPMTQERAINYNGIWEPVSYCARCMGMYFDKENKPMCKKTGRHILDTWKINPGCKLPLYEDVRIHAKNEIPDTKQHYWIMIKVKSKHGDISDYPASYHNGKWQDNHGEDCMISEYYELISWRYIL